MNELFEFIKALSDEKKEILLKETNKVLKNDGRSRFYVKDGFIVLYKEDIK